ncbi:MULTISPECIES: hypothetical protein [Gordonia]|uniref:Uncharacterized protein n=1 Tax=Gordonia sihwensis NBRC 108236 TaxID=1223544 RepID=L7LMZ9_9ACTN|nr:MULTISPECIES: hypothetical protein [Gordonia]AUH69678.1 hypothetical protein CXX93_16825 [Gordonia sp. YC-JH1]GAC62116.1 hypothetical protein GSI01S_29_00040 [Gordonia sihwensis NBRC 108236]
MTTENKNDDLLADLNVGMIIDGVMPEVSAAERISARHNDTLGYYFAPGIVIKRPNSRALRTVAIIMDSWAKQGNDPTEEQLMAFLKAFLGDQFDDVIEVLDSSPATAYLELLMDLFEGLMRLIPNGIDEEATIQRTEMRMRAMRPDLTDEEWENGKAEAKAPAGVRAVPAKKAPAKKATAKKATK